ncbi:hypothetical protein [Neptunitalea lumnitzerae]|uniref:Uncharacterized protein n=1 Tax=Neptunitalea lumnitzerae TaxID=2965509 RepID=A0ABQ5MIC5_9FLAO|nr:hypothetical protein [Neptunitalea sp. Y10]GLB49149.1 hypothetical protein Y10_15170 [Neptunitalea sp. Y10]
MTNPLRVIAEIDKNIKKKRWECMISQCTSNAINSHLIQQNGVLSNIAEKGHLVELKLKDIYTWKPNSSPFEFKKVGINNAMSHKVFCNHHDTSIFKSIENKTKNLNSYESFVLLSYRATCSEIFKKRVEIEKNLRLINSTKLGRKIDKCRLQKFVNGFELGIVDLEILKRELEKEIELKENRYSYYAYSYTKIPVYASAIFSATDLDYPEKDVDIDLLNIYVHILPLTNETLILIGYHNGFSSSDIKAYCKSWANLSREELEVKLSELFILYIENWGISPDFFQRISNQNKVKYLNLLQESIHSYGISKRVDFNFFKI